MSKFGETFRANGELNSAFALSFAKMLTSFDKKNMTINRNTLRRTFTCCKVRYIMARLTCTCVCIWYYRRGKLRQHLRSRILAS